MGGATSVAAVSRKGGRPRGVDAFISRIRALSVQGYGCEGFFVNASSLKHPQVPCLHLEPQAAACVGAGLWKNAFQLFHPAETALMGLRSTR